MCWPSHRDLEILVKINTATHPTHPSYEGIELAPTSRRATMPQWQTGQRPICVWRLRLLPIFATWSLDCLANGQMQFAPLDMSFVAKESQKIAEGMSIVVHEAWILSHSNMLSAKVQRFDSCKMSTNFSSLKGDEIQTSVFALHWVFSVSLVSPNHLQNLQKIHPKEQKLSIRFPYSVIGRSPPLLCNQCDALALREGRRFLRFRTCVFPESLDTWHFSFWSFCKVGQIWSHPLLCKACELSPQTSLPSTMAQENARDPSIQRGLAL